MSFQSSWHRDRTLEPWKQIPWGFLSFCCVRATYHDKFCRTLGEHQAHGRGQLALCLRPRDGNTMLWLRFSVLPPFSSVGISQWNNHTQHKSIFIITEIFLTCYYLSEANMHYVPNLLYFGLVKCSYNTLDGYPLSLWIFLLSDRLSGTFKHRKKIRLFKVWYTSGLWAELWVHYLWNLS